jgi:CcmD family protein
MTYVATAYVVFVTLIFVYVAIISARAVRVERELESLTAVLDQREREGAA